MQKSPIVRLRSPFLRRFVSLATVAAYLLVCTGVPIPIVVDRAAAAEDPSGAPYPCQGHRCGCRTAEQCWKACCCMSDLEKRMWAERNGVPLPDYLLSRMPAVVEVAAATEPAAEPVRACCRKTSNRSPAKSAKCAACPTETSAASSCSHDACESSSTDGCTDGLTAAKPAETAKSDVQWVSFLASQRCCGGATDIWAGGPVGLPSVFNPLNGLSFDEPGPFVPMIELGSEISGSFLPLRPPQLV